MTQRPISTLILVAALVAVISFFVAPWFAFRALREAAGQGDVRALSQLIDYSAVRQGLAPELVPGAPEPPPPIDLWRDPLGALKQALQPPPAAPPAQIDRYLTPSALAALSDGLRPGFTAAYQRRHPFPVIRYWGPNRCRISVGQKKMAPSQFTFERRGIYSWKLVRITPPDFAAPPPDVPAPAAGRRRR